MAETAKEELNRLNRELQKTSAIMSATQAAQNRTISALTKYSDEISRSVITTIQNIKQDSDTLKLKKKSLEITQKKLELARRELATKQQELTDAANARRENIERIVELRRLGTARSRAETLELDIRRRSQKELSKAHDEALAAQRKANTAVENFADQMELKTEEVKSLKFQRLMDAVNGTAKVMDSLVQTVRKTQQQLGLSAGSASKLGFENLQASVKSFADALKTGGAAGPGVTVEQIAQAQQDFQERFGGILTSEAATKMAQEAVRMGVTTEQLAEARQVFLTQTRGDANKAQAQTDKFVSEFAKKGLSAKTAMQEISKNSELLAKNGTRFASQMIAALASAKKIGFELSKISQFGDNLINDFEGFLEGQAELGAMGFGLDSSRLAEIAETGSDADLYNELRSQLAATGKDINKLRRSERLALESAFGMSIADMQKLAGETPEGGGEDTLDPAELQKNANEKLGNMVNFAEASVKALGVLGSALALSNLLLDIIARNTGGGLLDRLLRRGRRGRRGRGTGDVGGGRGSATRERAARARLARMRRTRPGIFRRSGFTGRVATAGRSLINRIASSRVGTLASRIASSRVGTATAGLARGGLSLLGRLAAPLTGLYTGYQEYKGQKAQGTGTGTAATMGAVKGAGIWGGITAGAAAGGMAGTAVGSAVPLVGNVVGGFVGTLLGGIAGAIGGEKFANWVNQNITKKMSTALDTAGNKVGDMWSSFTGWFTKKPGTSKPSVKRGDDVISQPGYGKRSLVTPSGVIALNNRDNIIAYADDLMGTTKLPLGAITGQFAKLGEFEQRANKVFAGLSESITGKFQGVKQFIGNIFGSSSEGLLGRFNKLKESGSGFVNSIKEGAFGKAKGLMDKFTGEGSLFSKAKGLMGGGGAGLKEKALGFASKIPGLGGLMGEGSMKEKAMGLASKIPGVGGLLGGEGGLKTKATKFLGSKAGELMKSGTGSKAAGILSKFTGASALTKKIPGLGTVLSAAQGYKAGGVKGALATGGATAAGTAIGGAIGTLIPIPGVGTMLGSIAGSKIGKLAGGLFGKKKQQTATISPEMMKAPSTDLSMMLGSQAVQQPNTPEQKPVTVDTSGIENKLNNFINALQTIQINMDGTKVGKVLVNNAEAASSTGVFKVQSR